MKSSINKFGESRMKWFPLNLTLSTILTLGMFLPSNAQEKQYSKPSWFFGGAGGVNFNFYRGTTQQLNDGLMVPEAFRRGFGAGLYLAGLAEYHRPNTRVGVMLQVGYDNRRGKFDQVISPCNCPMDLKANMSYLTVEPSLRFAPFRNNFYLYAGPRLAFNLEKSFTYQLGINPAYPNQTPTPEVNSDFNNVNSILLSAQIGAGYDIWLSSQTKKTQVVLSPFIAFQPYFGQDPRSSSSWNMTTLRVGVALKFGCGKVIPDTTMQVAVTDLTCKFWVNSPKNLPTSRRVRETFPLRNYVFFDLNSNQIPKRYVLLKKEQVKDFKEDQLEVLTPKQLSGRSAREMEVYYNILNILGDRMNKNPNTSILLVGSSHKGNADALAMSESVRKYLISVFGVNGSRITTEGRDKPKIPSEQPGATKELELLRQGDRRVSIESNSADLLMEFQSGPDAPLKPIEFMTLQEAPIDSYISVYAKCDTDTIKVWNIEITDQKGKVQNFGPYREGQEKALIPGKDILKNNAQGDYKVTMVGQTKNGKTIRRDTTVRMILWKPSEKEQGMRYSVIFEYNQSKTIAIYEKYLTDVITPKIANGSTVSIQGYTDIIGDAGYNQRLSNARANEVKTILENSVAKAGRTGVKFNVHGFGEDEKMSPFDNKFPEERFYNRSVIIDIIPAD